MNLKELKEQYAKLGAEIEKLESNKKWIPEKKEKVYFLNEIRNIVHIDFEDCLYDNNVVKYNKIFKTKEECENYRNYLNARDQYIYEFSNELNDIDLMLYEVYYSIIQQKLDTSDVNCININGIYFKTQEKAQEFLNKYKKEILKYEFGIEV